MWPTIGRAESAESMSRRTTLRQLELEIVMGASDGVSLTVRRNRRPPISGRPIIHERKPRGDRSQQRPSAALAMLREQPTHVVQFGVPHQSALDLTLDCDAPHS